MIMGRSHEDKLANKLDPLRLRPLSGPGEALLRLQSNIMSDAMRPWERKRRRDGKRPQLTFICSMRAFSWLVTSAARLQLSAPPFDDGCGREDTGRSRECSLPSSLEAMALRKPRAGESRPDDVVLPAYRRSGLSLLRANPDSLFSRSSVENVLMTLILLRLMADGIASRNAPGSSVVGEQMTAFQEAEELATYPGTNEIRSERKLTRDRYGSYQL